MNRIFKSLKFMIADAAKPVIIYYAVLLLDIVFWALKPVFFVVSNYEVNGFEMATAIFLFVVGLNSFKSSYLFLQANGVTRRQYYASGTLSLVVITASMTVIGAILYAVLLLFPLMGKGLTQQIYPGIGFIDNFLWTLAINLLAVFIGWLITMVYYRSGKLLKIIISLSPAILSVVLPILDLLAGGHLLDAPVRFFMMAMGFSGTPNAFIGAFSMAVAAAIALGLCFLLARHAPVKEQER